MEASVKRARMDPPSPRALEKAGISIKGTHLSIQGGVGNYAASIELAEETLRARGSEFRSVWLSTHSGLTLSLVGRCPELEDLTINGFVTGDEATLVRSLPKLRRLDVNFDLLPLLLAYERYELKSVTELRLKESDSRNPVSGRMLSAMRVSTCFPCLESFYGTWDIAMGVIAACPRVRRVSVYGDERKIKTHGLSQTAFQRIISLDVNCQRPVSGIPDCFDRFVNLESLKVYYHAFIELSFLASLWRLKKLHLHVGRITLESGHVFPNVLELVIGKVSDMDMGSRTIGDVFPNLVVLESGLELLPSQIKNLQRIEYIRLDHETLPDSVLAALEIPTLKRIFVQCLRPVTADSARAIAEAALRPGAPQLAIKVPNTDNQRLLVAATLARSAFPVSHLPELIAELTV